MVEFKPGMIIEDKTVKYAIDNLSIVQEVDINKKALYCYPIGMNAVIYQNKDYPLMKVLFKNAIEKKRINTFYSLFDNVNGKQIVEAYNKIKLGDIIFTEEGEEINQLPKKANNFVVVIGKSEHNRHIIKIINSNGKGIWTSFAVQNFEKNMIKVFDSTWRMGMHV